MFAETRDLGRDFLYLWVTGRGAGSGGKTGPCLWSCVVCVCVFPKDKPCTPLFVHFGLIHLDSPCVPAVVRGPCRCWRSGGGQQPCSQPSWDSVQSPLFLGASTALLSAGCVGCLESTIWGAKLFTHSFYWSIQRLKASFCF